MENLLGSIPYSTPLLKMMALVVLVVIIKIFLKILKISLPYVIKKNKLRYHIQDISALICGLAFLVFAAIFFASEIKEFAIPFSVIGAGIAFSLQ